MSTVTYLEVLSRHLSYRSGVPWPVIYDALTRIIADIIIRKNSGANVGQRPRLNFIEGANVTLTIADDGVDDEVDITIASGAAGGTIIIRKNSGANIGTRPRLNFIEGGNVTLTIVDDGVGNEVDITIAATSDVWTNQFFPAGNTDSVKGAYASVLMTDNVDMTVAQTIYIPTDLATITTAVVHIIPNASGNLRRGVVTNFADCNENYQTHTDSIAAGQVAVNANEKECIDISAALTNVAGGDTVGVQFTRYATNVLDTIGDHVHYLGILIEGTI